jgi:hypothetical protein
MLSAHNSMTAAKPLSTRLLLPRRLRKSRMADGAATEGDRTTSVEGATGELGTMGGTGCDDLESCSSVIRVEDTI